MSKKLTPGEARRLHDEAGAMTVKELRRFGELHFGCQWLSSAPKKTIVRGFRERLEKFLKDRGETL